MRRIVVIGTPGWRDRRTATEALQRVTEVYRGPYTALCDTSTGAGRYASAIARELGWAIDAHDVDTSTCAPACPTGPGHRRTGGPAGEYCPTARQRRFLDDLNGADLCIVLAASPHARLGQAEAARRGIAVWHYTPRGSK